MIGQSSKTLVLLLTLFFISWNEAISQTIVEMLGDDYLAATASEKVQFIQTAGDTYAKKYGERRRQQIFDWFHSIHAGYSKPEGVDYSLGFNNRALETRDPHTTSMKKIMIFVIESQFGKP